MFVAPDWLYRPQGRGTPFKRWAISIWIISIGKLIRAVFSRVLPRFPRVFPWLTAQLSQRMAQVIASFPVYPFKHCACLLYEQAPDL